MSSAGTGSQVSSEAVLDDPHLATQSARVEEAVSARYSALAILRRTLGLLPQSQQRADARHDCDLAGAGGAHLGPAARRAGDARRARHHAPVARVAHTDEQAPRLVGV